MYEGPATLTPSNGDSIPVELRIGWWAERSELGQPTVQEWRGTAKGDPQRLHDAFDAYRVRVTLPNGNAGDAVFTQYETGGLVELTGLGLPPHMT